MEPIGVLARWHVAFVIIHVMLTIMSIHLMNHLILVKDRFEGSVLAIGYLLIGILPLHCLRLGFIADQEWDFAPYIHISGIVSAVRLAVVWSFQMKLWENQSLAWNDNCEGCYSVLRVCFGVMVLLNILETIVACLIYDDPSRSGDMVLMVRNSRVRMRVPVGVALGRFCGVLIRCGRVLGGFDGLVAWRLRLGSMSAMFLTLVLGGFGSVMTAHVFWTCLGLAFLETILVCASRQKMFDVFVRFRYISVSVVKSVLVGYLILDVYLHPFNESSGCTEGSACYSRLRECFWVMLVFYSLEVFLAVLLLFFHAPKRKANIWAVYNGGILSMSTALSMTQVAIVGLLLGGSYGPLMTARGFWLCAITGIVEMAALMGITDWVGKAIKTRMDTGLLPLNTRSAFIMVPALRILGLFIISSLLKEGNGENTLIADMSNCDETCKARGRDLINFCVLAGKLQLRLIIASTMSIAFTRRSMIGKNRPVYYRQMDLAHWPVHSWNHWLKTHANYI